MRIERILTNIKTLGPGSRLAIWVNGCSRNCEGCVSKRLQDIDLDCEVNIEEILSDYNFSRIDGVTISGGEPFEQVEELVKLVSFLKNKKINDILIYTGYTYKELCELDNKNINFILNNITVLIDGPYIKSLDYQIHNLKGSENQNIIYLNHSYQKLYEEYIKSQRQMQEIQIANTLIGVGIPDDEYISSFHKSIVREGGNTNEI